jgi:putative tryptophan/tyrosine transport system substrate-binding protein
MLKDGRAADRTIGHGGQGYRMRRRAFMAGTAAALSAAGGARARQAAMPLVGFLSDRSSADMADLVEAFHHGLGEAGYEEGRNVAIDYRYAEGRYAELAGLASALVRRGVAVIAATGGSLLGRAAIAVTSDVPLVITITGDVPFDGLVAERNRSGGNVTGVRLVDLGIERERRELLSQLTPHASVAGFLTNPDAPYTDRADLLQWLPKIVNQVIVGVLVDETGRPTSRGGAGRVVSASADLDATFVAIKREHVDALLVLSSPLLLTRRAHLVALAARYAVPAIYMDREFVVAGGLMSYGSGLVGVYRRAGTYTGRILKGEKPSEMPLSPPDTPTLAINLKSAKALGLSIPDTLRGRAVEVIE